MTPLDDHTLNAYVDGELDPAERAQLETALAADSQLRARLAAVRRVALLGRAAVAGLARAEPPDAVRERVWPVERQPSRRGLNPYWAAAASLVLGLGVGAWLAVPRATPVSELVTKPVAWHQQAAWYHQLAATRQARSQPFLLDLEHDQVAPLQRALLQQLDHDIRVPDLSHWDLQVVGARLLLEQLRPLAQIFYRDQRGELVSLLVALDTGADTPPQFQRVGQTPVLGWREADTAYVLAGGQGPDRLYELAMVVLEQSRR